MQFFQGEVLSAGGSKVLNFLERGYPRVITSVGVEPFAYGDAAVLSPFALYVQ